jgi:hypothetical protein
MSDSIQNRQPERKTATIATEVRHKDGVDDGIDPRKPAIIEHPDTELQTTSKDQKPAPEEKTSNQK